MSIDLVKDAPRLEVPVFLFLGRHDHTVPTQLSEEFYASLRAPKKEVIWFEDSAHTPDLDEPGKFQHEVRKIAEQVCRDERAKTLLGIRSPA